VNVARDGYMFFLERGRGPIAFVDANPYVLQNVFKGVDPKTGRAEYDPQRKPGVGKTVDFCPMYLGAKNWQPAAYSPKTRMIYIPTSANLCTTMTGPETHVQGRLDLHRRTKRTLHRARRRPHRRDRRVERRHGQESLVA
jgi:alcohol dehydrogenase (cytochrome c)